MSKEKKHPVPEPEETAEVPLTEPDTEPAEDPAAAEAVILRDQMLRLRAEYDNYRKRSQKEREALFTDIRAETAAKLLPVLDNLERAAAAPCQDESYAKGVEMTLKQCLEVFAGLGVKPFGEAGEHFDPVWHNAVMHIEDENLGQNEVAEVFQTGYALGEKVLRHAMVKVAN